MSKKNKLFLPLLALPAALAGGAVFLYNRSVKTKHEIEVSPLDAGYAKTIKETYEEEIWDLLSFDGLKLKAYYYKAKTPSHLYAIVVHGYFGSHFDMMRYAIHYLEKGYNVLMPELRGHGVSEGNYVGFGYFDHVDIQGYIDMLLEKDKEAKIVLHGMSMGAATVMMVSGEYLPDNVKGIIEDAGYANAYEQCAYNLRQMTKLGPFPLLSATDLVMKKRAGYSLKDADPISYVKDATVPMLFIHGEADDFVPYSNLDPLFEACGSSHKEKLSVPGAGHVMSSETNPELFWGKVDSFLDQIMA